MSSTPVGWIPASDTQAACQARGAGWSWNGTACIYTGAPPPTTPTTPTTPTIPTTPQTPQTPTPYMGGRTPTATGSGWASSLDPETAYRSFWGSDAASDRKRGYDVDTWMGEYEKAAYSTDPEKALAALSERWHLLAKTPKQLPWNKEGPPIKEPPVEEPPIEEPPKEPPNNSRASDPRQGIPPEIYELLQKIQESQDKFTSAQQALMSKLAQGHEVKPHEVSELSRLHETTRSLMDQAAQAERAYQEQKRQFDMDYQLRQQQFAWQQQRSQAEQGQSLQALSGWIIPPTQNIPGPNPQISNLFQDPEAQRKLATLLQGLGAR